VLRKTNRAAEAEPLLQNVIATAPAPSRPTGIGPRELALNRASEALGDASTAVAMAENDKDAQKLLRQVKVAQALETSAGAVRLAVQDLTPPATRIRTSAEVRLGLGKAYIAKRQADLALPELQKAIELEPNDADASQLASSARAQQTRPRPWPYEKATGLEARNTSTERASARRYGQRPADRAVAELTKS